MKDKTARIAAIIALVFMAVFVISLTAFLAMDKGVVKDVFLYTAIGGGVVALILFAVIKLDGRGYSVVKMNNEIEMEKIRKENERLQAEADGKADESAGDAAAEKDPQKADDGASNGAER